MDSYFNFNGNLKAAFKQKLQSAAKYIPKDLINKAQSFVPKKKLQIEGSPSINEDEY